LTVDAKRALLAFGVIDIAWDGNGPSDQNDAAALLDRPFGIAFDPEGRRYIAGTRTTTASCG
jgi:hypothetical protein